TSLFAISLHVALPSCLVVKDRRFAAAANPLVAGFFELVARIFQRRIHARRRGQGKILDRSESAGTPRETGRSARSAGRVESRRKIGRATSELQSRENL